MEKKQISGYNQYKIEGLNDVLHIVEKFLLPKTYNLKSVAQSYDKFNFQNLKLLGIDPKSKKNAHKGNTNDDKILNVIRKDTSHVMNGISKGQGIDIGLYSRLKQTCMNNIISSQTQLFKAYYKDNNCAFSFVPNDKIYLISSTSLGSNAGRPNTGNSRPGLSPLRRSGSSNSFDNTFVRKESIKTINSAYSRSTSPRSTTATNQLGGIAGANDAIGFSELNSRCSDEKLLEYQVRICSMCKLCYGDYSPQYLLGSLDVALSYAKSGMWESMLEKLEIVEDQIAYFTSNIGKSNKFMRERQQYSVISLIVNNLFNELRAYAVRSNGQVDVEFVDIWINNTNEILDEFNVDKIDDLKLDSDFIESCRGLCQRVGEQIVSFIHTFNFLDDQIIGTVKVDEAQRSIPFWGNVIDFLRYSCGIVQAWLILIETSYFTPQHLVALQLPCFLNDRLNRYLCDVNQLMMYYRYLPEPTMFISKLPTFYEGLKHLKQSGMYEVKIPISIAKESKLLEKLSLTSFKIGDESNTNSSDVQNSNNSVESLLISYDLPMTFEEVLLKAAVEQGITNNHDGNHNIDNTPQRDRSAISQRGNTGSSAATGSQYFEFYKIDVIILRALHQVSTGDLTSAERLLDLMSAPIEKYITEDVSELHLTNYYRIFSICLVLSCYSLSNEILLKSNTKANNWLNSKEGRSEFAEYRAFVIHQKASAAVASESYAADDIELSKQQISTIKQQLRQTKMRQFLHESTMNDPASDSLSQDIQQKLDTAYRYRLKIYEIYEKYYGTSHVMTHQVAVTVASSLVMLGKFSEARLWLSKAMRILEKNNSDEMATLSKSQQIDNQAKKNINAIASPNTSDRAVVAVQLKLVCLLMQEALEAEKNDRSHSKGSSKQREHGRQFENTLDILNKVAGFYYTQAFDTLSGMNNDDRSAAAIAQNVTETQTQLKAEHDQGRKGNKPAPIVTTVTDIETDGFQAFSPPITPSNGLGLGYTAGTNANSSNKSMFGTGGKLEEIEMSSYNASDTEKQRYLKNTFEQIKSDVQMALDLNLHLAYLQFFYKPYTSSNSKNQKQSITPTHNMKNEPDKYSSVVSERGDSSPTNRDANNDTALELSTLNSLSYVEKSPEDLQYEAIGTLINLAQLTELAYGWDSIEHAYLLLQIGEYYALLEENSQAGSYCQRSLDAFEMNYESNNAIIVYLKKLIKYSDPKFLSKSNSGNEKLIQRIHKFNGTRYGSSGFLQTNQQWIEKRQLAWDIEETQYFPTVTRQFVIMKQDKMSAAQFFNTQMHFTVLNHMRNETRKHIKGFLQEDSYVSIDNDGGNGLDRLFLENMITPHKPLFPPSPNSAGARPSPGASSANKIKIGDSALLKIIRIECSELKHVEMFGGKNDVFVILEWCEQTVQTVVKDDAGEFALFDDEMSLEVDIIQDFSLIVKVFDKNSRSNVLIGESKVLMVGIANNGIVEKEYTTDIMGGNDSKTGHVKVIVSLEGPLLPQNSNNNKSAINIANLAEPELDENYDDEFHKDGESPTKNEMNHNKKTVKNDDNNAQKSTSVGFTNNDEINEINEFGLVKGTKEYADYELLMNFGR